MKHHDKWQRSLVKTLTYRIAIIVMMLVVSFAITRNWRSTLEITGWNTLLATTLYYLHERFWSRINWGRNSSR
jgi:uncharacterized membrane protein